MSTLLNTYHDALRELTERKRMSDERVVNCRAAADRARTALRGTSETIDRAVFEENQARAEFVELLESLKTMSDGGPPILHEKLAGFQKRLSERCEASRLARLEAFAKQEVLDKAESDHNFAKEIHARCEREWTQMAEQIQRLETPA